MSSFDFSAISTHLLGPTGALALAILGALALWRSLQASSISTLAALAASRDRLEADLRAEIARLIRERDDLIRRLEREHAERLADAKFYAGELNEHAKTLGKLAHLVRDSTRPPPGPISLPGERSPT